eukprot:1050826_1
MTSYKSPKVAMINYSCNTSLSWISLPRMGLCYQVHGSNGPHSREYFCDETDGYQYIYPSMDCTGPMDDSPLVRQGEMFYETCNELGYTSQFVGCVVECSEEDNDLDGYTECTGDCDDSDPSVFLGAVELCDDVDNNCNSVIDEGCTKTPTNSPLPTQTPTNSPSEAPTKSHNPTRVPSQPPTSSTTHIEWTVHYVPLNEAPPIPDGLRINALTLPAPVLKWRNETFWAFSFNDNRIAFQIVSFDEDNNLVRQWYKSGA